MIQRITHRHPVSVGVGGAPCQGKNKNQLHRHRMLPLTFRFINTTLEKDSIMKFHKSGLLSALRDGRSKTTRKGTKKTVRHKKQSERAPIRKVGRTFCQYLYSSTRVLTYQYCSTYIAVLEYLAVSTGNLNKPKGLFYTATRFDVLPQIPYIH